MAVQKSKVSRSKRGKRRSHKSLKKAKVMKNLEILILKKMNIENPYQNI